MDNKTIAKLAIAIATAQKLVEAGEVLPCAQAQRKPYTIETLENFTGWIESRPLQAVTSPGSAMIGLDLSQDLLCSAALSAILVAAAGAAKIITTATVSRSGSPSIELGPR